MARVKTDNRHLGILSGYEQRWAHNTATATYTAHAGEPFVLNKVVVNTSSSSAVVLVDTAVGVIATLKASISEGSYVYHIKLRGNLRVENPGGSDLTVTFSNN